MMYRLAVLVLFLLPVTALWAQDASDGSAFADFVEPDFPFITTTVDAGDLAPLLPARNVAVRCVVIRLGHDAYTCFDPDLLRMAVSWTGDFLSMQTMAAVSYNEAGNKQNGVPRVLGRPVFGTGIYPGWTSGEPQFADPRPPTPDPGEVGRGPLPDSMGRWNGLHVVDSGVVLDYTVGEADVLEQPSSVEAGDQVGLVRAFKVGSSADTLTLVVAESGQVAALDIEADRVLLYASAAEDTVTAIGLMDAPEGAEPDVVKDRYVTLRLPPRDTATSFSLVLWRGPTSQLSAFDEMLQIPLSVQVADVQQGSLPRWTEAVTTQAIVTQDTAALVADQIALPIPNPWRRNVRVADFDFFEDNPDRAAVSTFDGDVWLVSGLGGDLQSVEWRRFASGLFEPMSVRVRDGDVYAFGREGIVRLNDRNGDGEADFYENFSNLVIQSIESREYPLSMVEKPGGGFYLAKGGALDNGPKTAPQTMPGFRAGSPHSGSIVEVAPDGRSVRLFATGLREPYLGIHPQTGLVTASDQQGNFVPSTPIFAIQEGDFLGVPPTAHVDPIPEPTPPLTWVPHEVDPSGAEQVWALDSQMGPLDGELIHLSYGRHTAYLILTDSLGEAVQGGILKLPVEFPGPVMKGEVHPEEGDLYVIGFQIWGSQATGVSGFYRMRYTGQPMLLPTAVQAGEEGLILRFDMPLDSSATDVRNYSLRRWNYQRTSSYGSGHFRLDGTSGQEALPVVEAQLSADRRAVLLAAPDMQEVMQMAVGYTLQSADGTSAADTLHLSVNKLESLDLEKDGFAPVKMLADGAQTPAASPVEPPMSGVAPTAERGSHLYREIGCVACHSVDGSMAGKVGPSFKNLYGAAKRFSDGTTGEADAAYLRQSILEPSSQIVEGFDEGMPVYQGILSDADVEAIVLFIKSLE